MIITGIQLATLNSAAISESIPKILLAKLFLFGLLFLFYWNVRRNQKLTFYKNFGISKLQLFSVSFLMDALLTILIVFLLNLF